MVAAFALSGGAQAATPCGVAVLSDDVAFDLDLGPFACVLVDQEQNETLENILTSTGSAAFKPVASGLVDFGFGTARYWVRTKLTNAGAEPGEWWITHDIPSADLVRVRLVDATGDVQELLNLAGDAPFGARAVPHRHLVSIVALEPGQNAELVIDYVTGQSTQMPLLAESVGRFIARTQSEMAGHLILVALLLGMGAISTLYFYSLEGPPGLIYGAYTLSAGWFLAHSEGYAFQFMYPNSPWLNLNAFALLGFCTLAFGTWFISRLTRSRKTSQILYWSVVLSVTLLLLLVVGAPLFLSQAWYKIGGLFAAIFASVVQVAVIVAAIWKRQSGAWLLLAALVVTGFAIAFVTTGYLTEGLFPQEIAGGATRFAFFFEAIAYSGAIALRIRDARRARDRSLREQLRLTQESLHLSEAVQKAEADLEDAEQVAEQHRLALSSAAHDIRQPLTSIQMLLTESQQDKSKITGNISYIEDILRKGLEGETAPLGSGSRDPVSEGAKEKFPVSLVLDNIAAMFAGEAKQNGVDLRVLPCALTLVADPLSLMRAASNLVSNALNHAEATRIVVGVRRRSDKLSLEVHDNGKGMSSAELAQLTKRGAKSETSQGHGLGLAIAQELAAAQGMEFVLNSIEGRGTVGAIRVSTLAGWTDRQEKETEDD